MADSELVSVAGLERVDAPTDLEVSGDARTDRVAARRVPLALGQALFIVATLYLLLGGWRRDFRVPFGFSSDSLWFLMQSKSTVDNGWWWWNPRIGAPFGLDELAYPSNSNVDQAIVWAVSRAVPNAMAAVNVAWLLMVVLSGWSAAWCLRRLGISKINALVFGTLFALSPYALYRHVDHFALVIYLVPFACTAALWLASGAPRPARRWTPALVVLGGCALLGFNYVYYAFFAAFCVTIGALTGYVAYRDKRVVAAGAICLAAIVGCTFLNLAPSFRSWHEHGKPIVMRDKTPAEAELYGLKIRQLISPVYPHAFPPFRAWVRAEAAARYPNETENWTSRLGLVATLGFLGLLVLLFVPDRNSSGTAAFARSASRLTLAALLLSTIGGFGSLFSLLISSDIRAYNRICPFIAFFSLLAVALALDRRFRTPRGHTLAAVVVLTIGVADQGQAARHFNVEYAGIASDVARVSAFVAQLERALPRGAMVFQLPFRTYMTESNFGDMKIYDHFKPYLVSRTLRFSYPAFSNEQVRWQQAMARLTIRDLVSRLVSQGFSAVIVDRYGYEDRGAAVEAALLHEMDRGRLIAGTDRYLAFDLRGLASTGAPASAGSLDLVPASLSIAACPGQAMTVIDQIGDAHAPFGSSAVHVAGSGQIKVSGWAVDHPSRSPAAAVDVAIDRTPFASAYGAPRDDVASYFQRSGYRESGFTAAIPARELAAGHHSLSLRVVSADGRCYYQGRTVSIEIDR